MLFAPEYVEVVRFKGDVQTVFLPRNESMYKDVEEYIKFRDELMQSGMVIPTKDGYRLTEKGIFWGNTISRELSERIH